MRIAALTVSALLCVLAGCGTTAPVQQDSPFVSPNSLMAEEINTRIENIPYQHREELLLSLMWLAQQGEQAIPALLKGLDSDNPKTRSSCVWTLGRLADRRVIPNLQRCVNDQSETVRLEVARQLVLLGDYSTAPTLIEGLDSDKTEVRYLCHEALKSATGRDFGYDHLSDDIAARTTSVFGWRQWWSEYSGDPFFAQNYAKEHGLQGLAAPMGETKADAPKTDGNAPKTDGNAPKTGVEPVNPATNPATNPTGNPTPVTPTPVDPNGNGGN